MSIVGRITSLFRLPEMIDLPIVSVLTILRAVRAYDWSADPTRPWFSTKEAAEFTNRNLAARAHNESLFRVLVAK